MSFVVSRGTYVHVQGRYFEYLNETQRNNSIWQASVIFTQFYNLIGVLSVFNSNSFISEASCDNRVFL